MEVNVSPAQETVWVRVAHVFTHDPVMAARRNLSKILLAEASSARTRRVMADALAGWPPAPLPHRA
jgi:hypothetical protein